MATAKQKLKKGFSRTKVLISVCGLLIIVLPIISWGLNAKNSAKPNKQQIPNNTIKPATSAIQTSSYTIYYPTAWTLQKFPHEIYLLQPKNVQNSTNSHIVIQVADEKQITMAQITAGYTVFKYKKSTLRMKSGITMDRYSLVYPSTEGYLHSIAYVYESNGKIYNFKLSYTGQAGNPQLEGSFVELVNAFKLNN
ncbi:MAG TPA: hypothetical protein VLF93_06190 [Candidatus Saccharimonadales bacterium]|nr:hypothetical protein [Candidatus Saccharimonadales bacterium]